LIEPQHMRSLIQSYWYKCVYALKFHSPIIVCCGLYCQLGLLYVTRKLFGIIGLSWPSINFVIY